MLLFLCTLLEFDTLVVKPERSPNRLSEVPKRKALISGLLKNGLVLALLSGERRCTSGDSDVSPLTDSGGLDRSSGELRSTLILPSSGAVSSLLLGRVALLPPFLGGGV